MDAYLIINIIIIILISGLSIAVLAQNYRKSINIIFVVFAFSVSVWIISNYFSNSIYNPKDLVIIANYLVFFFSYLAALSLLKIAIIIANDYKANKIYNIMLIPSLIVGMLSFSKLIVIDVVPEQDIYAVIFGPLIGLYGIFLISILSSLFYVVYINRKRATKYNKSKLNILYISLLLSMPLLIITQFILPTLFGWFGFTNIGIISMLILVIGLYYGVIKHKLFDLKFVVIRSISYAIALIILSLIYGTVSYFLSNLLSSLVPKIVYTEILNIILIAAAVSVYGSLVKLFNKLTNKIFFREAYDPQTLINEINSIIVSNSSLDDSLYNIINIIKDSLKIEYIEIFDSYENIKYISSKTNSVKINDSLLYKLKNNKDKIISSDDMVDDYNLSLKTLMMKNKTALILKLISSDELVGYLFVGEKISGNPYSEKDLQILEIISDQLSVTIQNYMRFEEIRRFNDTLKHKIEIATEKLQKTNEKLKALDEAKDDFISMASHQLRTPLTSVKGYLSMVLEGDAGPINDLQRKFLSQSFISSQRMVFLISDLLNASRLKTGKFVIENKETYIPDIVGEELSQLEETIKARGLTLEYKKPKSFPVVNIDENKIRQVIMNFVDNAIYYTPAGGKIIVKLRATHEVIEYTVQDSGIGVPKEDQKHLFTKFYRAGNAKKARPDGTGLGIFMAKKVIIAQGGALIFKSEEGKGSVFGFSFPLKKIEIK